MPENKNQQPVLTEEERKILDQSYALAALRGAAAGGVLGGAAFGGAPLLYGMDSNNPRADFEKDFPNTLRTSAITGGVGTILGAGTGALLNSAALARRKKKIRRKVTDGCLESLPKTAAARDYITRGTHFNSSDSLQKRSKVKCPFFIKNFRRESLRFP